MTVTVAKSIINFGLNLVSVYVEEGYWNVDIEEDILSTFN